MKTLCFIMSLLLITYGNAFGAVPTKPYDFTEGTTIRSAEVDSNFDELYGYLNTGVDNLRANALDATTEISSSLCSNGQVLKKVSGAWACSSQLDYGTSLPATCTKGYLFVDTDSDDCADTAGGDGAICVCKSVNSWTLVSNY